jgi:hypothetical protein
MSFAKAPIIILPTFLIRMKQPVALHVKLRPGEEGASTMGNNNVKVTFEGETKQSFGVFKRKHGFGKTTYQKKVKQKVLCFQTICYKYDTFKVYEGSYANGRRHGMGKITQYPSRAFYEGEWNSGKRQGKGIFQDAEGNRYVGEFKDNEFDGRGKYTYSSGVVYDGSWSRGNWMGQGKVIYPAVNIDENGGVAFELKTFEGQFYNNKRSGLGCYHSTAYSYQVSIVLNSQQKQTKELTDSHTGIVCR